MINPTQVASRVAERLKGTLIQIGKSYLYVCVHIKTILPKSSFLKAKNSAVI